MEMQMNESDIQAGIRSLGDAVKAGNNKIAARLAALDALTAENLPVRMSDLEQKAALANNAGTGGPGTGGVSLFTKAVHENADAIRALGKGTGGRVSFEVKNTILTPVGSPNTFAPADRIPGVIAGQSRSLDLFGVIGVSQCSGNTVEGARESLFTNAAAETSEGETKPESTITVEPMQFLVCTIAHILKVGRQALEDSGALGTYLNQRMTFGVRSRLEQQIVVGNGTSPNISGILNAGNFTAAEAQSGEALQQFVRRQKSVLRNLGVAERDMIVVLNPDDWSDYELSITSTDLNLAALIAAGVPPSLWRLPVVESSSVTVGTAIVMAASAVQLYEREGVIVQLFEQDADNVSKNLITVRAEGRFALGVYQPWAIRAGAFVA
jgi:HK97 family phage major capsid protein